MLLQSHAPAVLEEVRVAHEEAVEAAHEHLSKKPKIVLKKLSARHKNAIALLLQGLSREDVAEATRYTPEYMSVLLQQPLAREYIAHLNRGQEVRLEALYGKSVDAIADGLNHQSTETRLKSAKLQLQATGRLEPSDEGKQTAEDVVSAILLGVQVNVNTK